MVLNACCGPLLLYDHVARCSVCLWLSRESREAVFCVDVGGFLLFVCAIHAKSTTMTALTGGGCGSTKQWPQISEKCNRLEMNGEKRTAAPTGAWQWRNDEDEEMQTISNDDCRVTCLHGQQIVWTLRCFLCVESLCCVWQCFVVEHYLNGTVPPVYRSWNWIRKQNPIIVLFFLKTKPNAINHLCSAH